MAKENKEKLDDSINDLEEDELEKEVKKSSTKEVKKTAGKKKPVETKKSDPVKEKAAENKEEKSKEETSEGSNKMKLVLALVVIVAVAVMFMYSDKIFPSSQTDSDATDSDNKITGDVVAASVNDFDIMQSDIEKQYSLLPEQLKSVITLETIINQTINEELLLQEAESQGVSVTDEEVDDLLSTLLEQNGISEQEFEAQLAERGTNLDEVKEFYVRRLTITKLLNETILSQLDVTDSEIKDYYEANTESFTSEESVKASHILVNTSEKAESIIEQLEDGADFAELASEHSIDPSAQFNQGDLGYFSRGTMVVEFEEAAFSLNIGEISPEPVESQFGYHIIYVVDKREAGTLPLEDVEESISQTLVAEKQDFAVRTYIEQLRNNAEVIIYYGTDEQPVGEVEDHDDSQSEDAETTETETSEDTNKFLDTGDDICLEDGKPVVRLFSTSTCPACEKTSDLFDDVVSDYSDEIIAYHWEVDLKDNTLTEDIEGSIPKSEIDILLRYDPTRQIPAFIVGCKYVRLGNAISGESPDLEESELRSAIGSVLG